MLPSGGVWRIAFWIRLNSTRWSCSWLPWVPPAASPSSARTATEPASALGRIASTAEWTSSSNAALHRPLELLRLQAGEVEEIVDQRAERAHVRVHAGGVLAPLGGLDDLVVDRGGEQAERGDRRAEVVRDGSEELAPHPLLAVQALDHRVDVAADVRDLVGAVAAPCARRGGPRRPRSARRTRDRGRRAPASRAGARSRARARRRRRRAGPPSRRRGWRRTSGPRTAPPRRQRRRAECRDRPELAAQASGPASAIASPASTVTMATGARIASVTWAPWASS